jgi:hypothetical protein
VKEGHSTRDLTITLCSRRADAAFPGRVSIESDATWFINATVLVPAPPSACLVK